ncbi:MAG TPA: cupredoxin domain-containing protein [Marmoricola sp.]|nr:cupredoxin domain-containing protein [Marmoricola sp.]
MGSSSRRAAARRRPRIVLLGLLLVVLVATSGCVKTGISPKARDTHDLFYIILWLALPVFLFVEGMLVVCLVRFRRKRNDVTEPVQDYGRTGAIVAFFAGPLVVVVVLLAFGEHTLSHVDHLDPQPAQKITVTGFQWEWSASYPQGFTVAGKTRESAMVMELPVNRTTQITLKSDDVIHEFYVPDLLFMRNAVPGHPNTFTIKPDRIGTYKGQCAQYCGLWHAQMRFVLKVVSPGDYRAWVARQKHASAAAAKKKASSCSTPSDEFTITAHNIQWDKSCIAVEAGKPTKVTIVNKDAGVAHNFAVWQSSALKKRFFVTPDVTGVATKTFTLPALPAGSYYFQCDVHGPAMSGTFVVKQED